MVTLQQKLTEIDRAMEAIELQGDNPVRALSMYAGGQGTDYQDLDDIRESVDAFVSYWSRLNQYEAERFRSVVNKRHPTLSRSTGRLGAVWIVSLGDPVGSGGGGLRPPDSLPVRSETIPLPQPSALRAQGDGGVRDMIIDSSSTENKSNIDRTEGSGSLRVHSCIGNTRMETRDTGVNDLIGTNDRRDQNLDEDPIGVDGRLLVTGAGWLDATPVGDSEGPWVIETDECLSVPIAIREEDRDEGPRPDRILTPDEAIRSFQVAESYPPLLIVEGIVTDPDPREPPSDPVFVNDVWLLVRRVPRSQGGPGSQVTLVQGDATWADPTSMIAWFYPNVRPSVAILAALCKLCSTSWLTTMRVHLQDSGPAKHLVQRHMRFHSPLMFDLVLRLHRLVAERQLSVTIRGGIEIPQGLQSAFERVHAVGPHLPLLA